MLVDRLAGQRRPSEPERFKALAENVGGTGIVTDVVVNGKKIENGGFAVRIGEITGFPELPQQDETLVYIPKGWRNPHPKLTLTSKAYRPAYTALPFPDSLELVERKTRTYEVSAVRENSNKPPTLIPSSTHILDIVPRERISYPPVEEEAETIVCPVAEHRQASGVRLYLTKMEDLASTSPILVE